MKSLSGTAADVLKSTETPGVERSVVSLDSKDNFFIALWKLHKHNITAAPIFDAEKKEWVGMCDMLDLVTFALVTFEDRKLLYEREMLQYGSADLANKPEYNVHLISNMSCRNRLVTVPSNASVQHLVGLFGVESGLHRVCVLDENKTMIGLISQTDLIRFLSTHDYKDLSNYSIGEWAVKPLVTCKPTTEASKAFELLIDNHVSALPILDDAGHLISSFSASDLKGAEPGRLFASLQSSVVTFLKNTEQRMRPGIPGRRALACRIGDNMFEVMVKLVTQKVHRIWVVDAKNVVIGVVSFSDIFSQLEKK